MTRIGKNLAKVLSGSMPRAMHFAYRPSIVIHEVLAQDEVLKNVASGAIKVWTHLPITITQGNARPHIVSPLEGRETTLMFGHEIPQLADEVSFRKI